MIAVQSETAMPQHTLPLAMAEACKGRRFFTTKDHYLGVGPDITWPDDKICIIPGCCAPFVIRPRGAHYELIGECYVAGLMDGEVLDQRDLILEELVFE